MIDVLVIGGGIAGLSAAARLSHHGRVAVLERETALAYHTSGRSAALFEECYGKPTTVALNRASKANLAEVDGGVLSPRGLMMVARADTDDVFEADCKAMTLQEISMTEARALIPVLGPAVTRAAMHDEAWDIDTDRLIQTYAREVRGNGGTVQTGAEVTAITRLPHGWQVQVGAEAIEAKRLVNAAGAWADVIAAMAGIAPLGLTPLRRSMARIPAPDGHDVGPWPMLFGPGETWYAKPDAGALIVSPADEDPSQPMDAWADDMVLAEGLARFEAHVTMSVTRLLANWAGLRTFAPDRQLVIGPDPQDSTFLWSAGQGGYGFQTAPAASRLLADLATGQAPDLDRETVAALSPARFR